MNTNRENSDKGTENNRYSKIAIELLEKKSFSNLKVLSAPLQSPYHYYNSLIRKYANSSTDVLEIGAGMGENTECLLETGASVCATDISKESLSVLKMRLNHVKLTTVVADMEAFPFDNESFDMIVTAGSLSYGDNIIVLNEIYRILKPNGVFISVDSLSNSLIYRINRFFHYLKGERTWSTLERMPTLKLINAYEARFSEVETKFFGSISYLMPLLILLLGEKKSTNISNSFDRLINVKRSAFKYVLVARKK